MDVKGGQIECVKRRLELTGEGDFLKSIDDLILSMKVKCYVHGLVRG